MNNSQANVNNIIPYSAIYFSFQVLLKTRWNVSRTNRITHYCYAKHQRVHHIYQICKVSPRWIFNWSISSACAL